MHKFVVIFKDSTIIRAGHESFFPWDRVIRKVSSVEPLSAVLFLLTFSQSGPSFINLFVQYSQSDLPPLRPLYGEAPGRDSNPGRADLVAETLTTRPPHLPTRPQHLPTRPQHLPTRPPHLPTRPPHLPTRPPGRYSQKTTTPPPQL